jgi:hypothetical protein
MSLYFLQQQQQQQSQQLAAQQQQQLQSQQQTPYSAALQQTSGASSSLSANNANILQQVAAAAALSQLPSATQNQLRPYFGAYQSPAVTSGLGSMFYPNSLFGAHSLNPFFSSGVGQVSYVFIHRMESNRICRYKYLYVGTLFILPA